MPTTSLPTLQPTTVFDSTNISHHSVILTPTAGSFQFQSYANIPSEYDSRVYPRWRAFLNDYFAESIYTYIFYDLYVWSYQISVGEQEVTGTSFSCLQNRLTQEIFQAVTNPSSTFVSVLCAGVPWTVLDGILCVNCTTFYPNGLEVPSKYNVILAPNQAMTAPADLNEIKYGMAMQVGSKIQIPDSVPSARIITATTTNHSVYLEVNVSSTGYGGLAYCGYLVSGSALGSVSVIKAQGFLVTTAVKEEKVAITFVRQNLTLTGMVDSTTYDIYCYTEDSYGNGMLLESVLNTKVTRTTLCCAAVALTNAPSHVVDNPYASPNPDSYEFRFELDAPIADDSVVTVVPEISLRSGRRILSDEQSFIIAPSSIQFSKSSQSRKGVFIVSILQPSVIGNYYTFTLGVTGSPRYVYHSGPIVFKATSNLTIPAAPSLKSSKFLNSGNGGTVTFNAAVDVVRASAYLVSGSWPCSRLFEFAGAEGATCAMKSSTSVSMTFSSTTTIKPLEPVKLKAGLLYSACAATTAICNAAYPVNGESTVNIQFPDAPVTPVPSLLFSPVIGACSDLVIDPSLSTGHGGRPWKQLLWQVSAALEVDVSGILKILNAVSSINVPITVPSAVIIKAAENSTTAATPFTISLGLVNYLQVASPDTVPYFSRSFTLDTTLLAPIVKIVGASYRTIYSKDVLTLAADAMVPNCDGGASASDSIVYSWRVFRDGVLQTQIISSSSNPKVMSLPPYALVGGKEHTFSARATTKYGFTRALVVVYVEKSPVYVVVEGGASVSVSPLSSFPINASLSRDTNFLTSTANDLAFEWQCQYVNPESTRGLFGKDCSSSVASCTSAACTIPGDILFPKEKLEIYIKATASDGRFGTKMILLTVQSQLVNMRARVMYAKTSPVFNANERLEISGLVGSNVSYSAEWSLVSAGSLKLTDPGLALTQLSRQFSTTTDVNFPLKAEKNFFTAGLDYTFRLQATSTQDSSNLVFSEITLTANGPPRSGTFQVLPIQGIAFSTIFEFLASGWVDDVSDYPILYSFQYRLGLDSNDVRYAIQLNTEQPFVYATLPEGPSWNNNNIYCVASIRDRFDASSTLAWPVTSQLDPHVNVEELSSNLTGSLDGLLENYNVDGVLSVVSSVGALLGNKNCTGYNESQCASTYNRRQCFAKDFTCGSCVDGFVGIAGSSNTMCINPAAENTAVTGEDCNSTTICLFGSCQNYVCVADLQSCPTAEPELECSGRGICKYVDGYGISMDREDCTTENSFCTAVCACDDGYGGVSCSLNASQVAAREVVRIDLCNSLVNASRFQDESADMLQSLIGPLSLAFDPSDFGVNSTGFESCADVLKIIMGLAGEGFIGQLEAQYSEYTAAIISSFAGSSDSSGLYDVVTGSVLSLTVGIDAAMVPGEETIDISTATFRISFSFPFEDDVKDATIQVPQSDYEKSINQSVPRLVLSGDGLGACGSSDGGYNKFSVSQFSAQGNPYTNASDLSSSLFRFTSSGGEVNDNVASVERTNYTFTTYFNTPQNFNDTGANSSNFTLFPSCVLLVTEDLESSTSSGYEKCNCNVSAYDAYSVTFMCFDVGSLCGNGNARRRRLSADGAHLPSPYDSVRVLSGGRFYSTNPRYAHQLVDKELHMTPPSGHADIVARRKLQAESGDEGSIGDSLTASQFGSLLIEIEKEFIQQIKDPPTVKELIKSPIAISFVGGMFFLLIFGYVYFCYWDIYDRNIYRYLRNAEKRHKRKRKYTLKKDGSVKGLKGSLIRRQSEYNGLPVLEFQHHEDITNDKDGKFSHTPEQSSVEYLVNQFLMATMSASGLITQKRALRRFWQSNLRNHLWIRFFTYPSTYFPRSIRYLNFFTEILVIIFLDTLFYGFIYADNSDRDQCRQYLTQETCERETQRAFAGVPVCEWTYYDDPSSAPQYFYNGQLIDGSCDIRPPIQNLIVFVIFSVIVNVVAVFPKALSIFLLNNICSCQPDFDGTWMPDWFVALFVYPTEPEFHQTVRMSKLGESLLKVGTIENGGTDGIRENLSMLSDVIGQYRYYDAASVEEELDFVVRSVFDFIRRPPPVVDLAMVHVADADDRQVMVTEELVAAHEKRREAVLNFMNINPDCTPAPFSWQQRLLYGRHHNNYLRMKLRSVRRTAEEISDKIETLAPDEHDNRDAMLVQYFILEQLPPIKRFALAAEFFQFDMAKPRSVYWLTWMVGWIVQMTLVAGMLVWTLVWAVNAGQMFFKAWAYQVVFVLMEDLFISQVLLVYILHVAAIENMQSELRHVYHALKVIMTEKCNNVARTVEDGIRVVQHYSAVCRAARKEEVIDLPSSMLLTQLTDAEVDTCRVYRREKMTWMTFFIVGIPTLFGLFGETVQTVVFDVFASLFWGTYLVINYLIYDSNIYVLVLVYLTLMIILLYYRYVVIRGRHQSKSTNTNKFSKDGVGISIVRTQIRGWVKTKRTSYYSRSPLKMAGNILTAILHKIRKALFPKEDKRKKLCWRNMNLVGAQVLLPDISVKRQSLRRKGQNTDDSYSHFSYERRYGTNDGSVSVADESRMSHRNSGGDSTAAGYSSPRASNRLSRAWAPVVSNGDSKSRSKYVSAKKKQGIRLVHGFEDLRLIENVDRIVADDSDDEGIPEDVTKMLSVVAPPKKTVGTQVEKVLKKPKYAMSHYYSKVTQKMIDQKSLRRSSVRVNRFSDPTLGVDDNQLRVQRIRKWREDRDDRLRAREQFLGVCSEKFNELAVSTGLTNSSGDIMAGDEEVGILIDWVKSNCFAVASTSKKSAKNLYKDSSLGKHLEATMDRFFELSSDGVTEGVTEDAFLSWINFNNISDDPNFVPPHVNVIQRSDTRASEGNFSYAPSNRMSYHSSRLSRSGDVGSIIFPTDGSVGVSVASNATPQVAGFEPFIGSAKSPPTAAPDFPKMSTRQLPVRPTLKSGDSARDVSAGQPLAMIDNDRAIGGDAVRRADAVGLLSSFRRQGSTRASDPSSLSPLAEAPGHANLDDDDAGGERLDIHSDSDSSGDEAESNDSGSSAGGLVL